MRCGVAAETVTLSPLQDSSQCNTLHADRRVLAPTLREPLSFCVSGERIADPRAPERSRRIAVSGSGGKNRTPAFHNPAQEVRRNRRLSGLQAFQPLPRASHIAPTAAYELAALSESGGMATKSGCAPRVAMRVLCPLRDLSSSGLQEKGKAPGVSVWRGGNG